MEAPLASNIAIVPTNRAELNLYGSIGVIRVMRSDKNPSIKFTKLFREPLLQKLLALGVAEIAVFFFMDFAKLLSVRKEKSASFALPEG